MSQNDEHRHLRSLLSKLEASADTGLGLLSAFADLHECLEGHFESEEQEGGLFDLVRRSDPMCAEQADTLEREHAALLRSAEFIAGRADFLGPDELKKEVEQFVSLVRAHEIAEGMLYQEAVATRSAS
jgi:hypothetical protein